MARVVIYLLEPKLNALHPLDRQEYQPGELQAALIIRNDLKRPGLIEGQLAGRNKQPKISTETDDRGSTW